METKHCDAKDVNSEAPECMKHNSKHADTTKSFSCARDIIYDKGRIRHLFDNGKMYKFLGLYR